MARIVGPIAAIRLVSWLNTVTPSLPAVIRLHCRRHFVLEMRAKPISLRNGLAGGESFTKLLLDLPEIAGEFSC